MTRIRVNGREFLLDIPDGSVLLWVLRERLGFKGVKYGCGIGECGFCTVLVDGEPTRSCQTTVAEVRGRDVLTIEGLSPEHPVIRAWIEEQVPQCGYCQPAQILHAVSLLRRNPEPDRPRVIEAMNPVLCRCGTYPRILRAVERAARLARGGNE